MGNVFVAGASVAYYGPFTGVYRQELVENWLNKCVEKQIPVSEKYTLENTLGDPVKIRDWSA